MIAVEVGLTYLAVVKSVANAHQGEVHLISKPGEGAHFVITLPLLPNEAGSESLTSPQESGDESK